MGTPRNVLVVPAIVLCLGAAGLAGMGCASSWPAEGFPPLKPDPSRGPERITVKTFGPPGQPFTGTLVVDGSPRELSGVTPAEFPLTCRVVEGEVRKAPSPDEFGFVVVDSNGNRFSTPPGWSVFRFRYHAGSLEVQSSSEMLPAGARLP